MDQLKGVLDNLFYPLVQHLTLVHTLGSSLRQKRLLQTKHGGVPTKVRVSVSVWVKVRGAPVLGVESDREQIAREAGESSVHQST